MPLSEISKLLLDVSLRFGAKHMTELKAYYQIKEVATATAEQKASLVAICQEQLALPK